MGLMKHMVQGLVVVTLMAALVSGLGVRSAVAVEFARDFIVGDPSVVGAPEFAAGTTVQVAGGALNLRSLPTLAADVGAVMADGTTLTVEDGPILSDGYTWHRVTSGQYGTGWSAGEFLAAS